MTGAIQSATTGMGGASQAVAAVSLKVLRKALDQELNVAQQMVNMVVETRVYDANARMIETSQGMLDIVV